MSDEIQPLAEESDVNDATEEPKPNYPQAWKDLQQMWKTHPLVQALASVPKPAHVHGPFTFLLNQNHNALRGCTTCGAAWVGSMAGRADELCWHPVGEMQER